jgi:hypothetical protein
MIEIGSNLMTVLCLLIVGIIIVCIAYFISRDNK